MKKVYPYLFIFPAMAGIVAFVLYPMVKLITQSFYKVNPMNEANSRFIGLENYTKMFQTAAFKKALVNTGYYALFSVILIMVIALLLAVWLSGKQDRFHSFIQGSVFLPHVISMVSIGLIFQQMMDPDFGVLIRF